MGVSLERRLRDAAGLPRLGLRQRLHPLRPQLAGERAGRRRSTACSPEDIGAAQGPQRATAQMVPLATLVDRPRHQPARRSSTATTCIPSAEINGDTAPGRQLRPGASPSWTRWRDSELPAGHGLRVDRADAPADPGRQHGRSSCSSWARVFVFLVLAAQYESWSLPLAIILIVPMCLLAAIAGVWLVGIGQQHLHADRPGRADRPGGQERDPDRRVRQAAPGPGQAALRGDRRGLPAAAAADPDDVVRVHPGRGAAGAGHGRRRRDARRPGHRRVQRHARRDRRSASSSRRSSTW